MAYFEEKAVQPIMITARCECGGTFEPNGMCLTTHPCKFSHRCNSCGKTEVFDCQYPQIKYVDI